jgi:hypothetical protein
LTLATSRSSVAGEIVCILPADDQVDISMLSQFCTFYQIA